MLFGYEYFIVLCIFVICNVTMRDEGSNGFAKLWLVENCVSSRTNPSRRI